MGTRTRWRWNPTRRSSSSSATAWDSRAPKNPAICRSAAGAEYLPLLQQAVEWVANVRVCNVGALGGNLCFGDPHSDPAPVLLVYDTRGKIGKHSGGRTLGLDTFYGGVYETALEPDELLVELEVAALPPGVGSAYLRAARFERPSLGVAVAAAQHDGRLTDVRLAVSCAGPVPMRLQELGARLEGAMLAEASRSCGRRSAITKRSCSRSMTSMDQWRTRPI
jgi:aerobic carbon-monoxide dehydrogenase medium subunit